MAAAKGFATTRLYIGNLSPSVDEYTLIQICSKHGKISKMDYLFHKSGPQRGKPRGYAFVEYQNKEEALRAMVALHDKLVRGKRIVVTAASEQTQHPDDVRLAALSGHGGRSYRGGKVEDPNRPTAISLLKGQGVAGVSTNRKIAALEAKLAAIQRGNSVHDSGTASPQASTSTTTPADGEKWLDSLAQTSEEEKDKQDTIQHEDSSRIALVKSEDNTTLEKSDSTTSSPKKTIITIAQKAGLPTRPIEDATAPT